MIIYNSGSYCVTEIKERFPEEVMNELRSEIQIRIQLGNEQGKAFQAKETQCSYGRRSSLILTYSIYFKGNEYQ